MSGVPQPQHCSRLRLYADERGGDEGHQRVHQLQSPILLNLFNAVPAGSGDLASPLPQKVLQVEETDRVREHNTLSTHSCFSLDTSESDIKRLCA